LSDDIVSCDGDGTHPFVYIHLEEDKEVVCPYCNKIFPKKK